MVRLYKSLFAIEDASACVSRTITNTFIEKGILPVYQVRHRKEYLNNTPARMNFRYNQSLPTMHICYLRNRNPYHIVYMKPRCCRTGWFLYCYCYGPPFRLWNMPGNRCRELLFHFFLQSSNQYQSMLFYH